METKEQFGGREDRLDEVTFEPVPEPELRPTTGIILESLRRREPMRTIR